jgi:hypothetical protein
VFCGVQAYLRLFWHSALLHGALFVVAENAFIFGLAYLFLPDEEKALA